MATSTSSVSAVFPTKLMWDSPVDAEKIFETVDAEFKTKTILESVNYVFNLTSASDVITAAPPIAQVGQASYAARMENHEKSVRKLNADASKAMGILMSIFHPDSNAHRSLVIWFTEPIVPALVTSLELRRRDYNFRNAYAKWQGEYRPNKQYNLDTILKEWEALDDRQISFAEFWGTWHKLVNEMTDIGHPPTDEKKYEQLRKNVTNPNLKSIVLQLSYAVGKRISLNDFFDDCLHVTRTSKELDTGRTNGKRKAHEEPIVGRTVQLHKKPRDNNNREMVCWRCGEAGHMKINNTTGARCHNSYCTVCHNVIGMEPHDARNCCSRSMQVFGNLKFPKMSRKERGENTSSTHLQSKGKRGRKNGKEKSSYYGPKGDSNSSTSTSTSSVPKEIQQLRALLAFHEASHQARVNAATARRVTSAEDSDR